MTAVAEPRTGTLEGVLRIGLTLMLAALFTAGVVALMMALAGVFEPKVKVKPSPVTASKPAVPSDRALAVVRLHPPSAAGVGGRDRPRRVRGDRRLENPREGRGRSGQGGAGGQTRRRARRPRQGRPQVQDRAGPGHGGGGQGEVRPGRDRAWAGPAAPGPGVHHPERARPGQHRHAGGKGRPGTAPGGRWRRLGSWSRTPPSCAPISGRVVDKKVNAGDTVSPGQALLTMYDPSHMQLIATVRESLALRLKVGQQVPAGSIRSDYECHARRSARSSPRLRPRAGRSRSR